MTVPKAESSSALGKHTINGGGTEGSSYYRVKNSNQSELTA